MFHRELEPGFHWRWPGVEAVLAHSVVTSVHALQPQSLTTSDGHAIVIQAVLSWKVSDIRKLFLEVEDSQHALLDAACGAISGRVVSSTLAQVTTQGFLEDALKEVRRRAFRWGVEVTTVQLLSVQRCKSLRLIQDSVNHA